MKLRESVVLWLAIVGALAIFLGLTISPREVNIGEIFEVSVLTMFLVALVASLIVLIFRRVHS